MLCKPKDSRETHCEGAHSAPTQGRQQAEQLPPGSPIQSPGGIYTLGTCQSMQPPAGSEVAAVLMPSHQALLSENGDRGVACRAGPGLTAAEQATPLNFVALTSSQS